MRNMPFFIYYMFPGCRLICLIERFNNSKKIILSQSAILRSGLSKANYLFAKYIKLSSNFFSLELIVV